MGVPGLQTWLRRRYPEAFVPLPEGMAFDHVYIDMSSTLHQVIRRARTKSYFHSQLHRRLDDILALARPRQRVVLALDGPAPLAKLLEQRRRRRREVERSQRAAAAAAETAAADVAAAASGAAPPSGLIAGSTQQAWSSTVDALALQGGFRPPNPELSTLALTTGTRLMLEVHSSLAAYICKKLADPATAHLSFEFSDSTVKGEGELKILSRLLHPDSAAQPGDTHLVLGADSDLLLMALVSGQPGVYILNDLADGDSRRHHRHRRRSPRDAAAAAAVAAADAAAAAAAIAAAKALLAAPAAGLSSGEESDGDEVSSSGSDTEVESDESDSEPEKGEAAAAGGAGLPPGAHVRKLPALAAVAAGAASQAEAVQPPPMAFSRDAAERLWREQHLAGGGGGPDEVTGLALDLMLLATMCSGNDYLPAIQGMQLSNKHRPGLWDLYCGMRQEPRWAGQTLAVRGCDCGGAGAGHPGNDCPTISFNWPMLTALLSEYYRQRFVSLEGPNTAAVDPPRGTDPTAAPAGGVLASAILGSGSLSSVDLADSSAPVWGPEGLAAAAAQATAQQPGKPEGTAAAVVEGIELARQQRGRGPAVALRGLEPEPDSYLQGLEWVLQMYCSGAVRDYRFAYDLAAPSLTHLIAIMHQRSSSGSGSSSSRSSSEVSETSAEGELQAGAAAAADEQAQQAQPRRRSTQPLVPAACAMALLPRGGRMHAATALQHLMDEGSQLEEIYATCDECTQLGLQLGSMGRELDGARVELAAAQLQLGELAAEALAGRAVTAPALELLEGEVERLEGEVARLRELVSALSRRQQEHLMDAHPYKPFPTEELEAAVAAVPLGAYPRRERKLAQFGREFVFRRAPAAAEAGDVACLPGLGPLSLQQQQQQQAAEEVGGARPGLEQAGGLATLALEERRPAAQAGAALSEQQQQQGERVQPWVLDCLSFAAAYPRVADPILLRRSGLKVERGVLPLRPYMQPPHMQHRSDRTAGRPGALLAHCQLARWGQRRPTARHVFGQHKQQHHHKRTLQRAGSLAHQSHLPPAAAVAAGQQLGQRGQLHTFSLGWSGSGSSGSSGGGSAGRGVSRAQLTATAVRSTLLQGCTRLLGSIRMLRPL